jgi:hypothetical protein
MQALEGGDMFSDDMFGDTAVTGRKLVSEVPLILLFLHVVCGYACQLLLLYDCSACGTLPQNTLFLTILNSLLFCVR